jgi:sugar (pentulose or hexulose) kinase
VSEDAFAGLDVGTTSVKCVVFDAVGRELGSAARPTPWGRARGGEETSADSIVDTSIATLLDAVAHANARVLGVGITGMAESGALLDRGGDAVSPVVAWSDRRADQPSAALFDELGQTAFSERTGLPPSGRNTLAKLNWESVAASGELTAAVGWLGVPELVARRLGAAPVAERSLASRTGLFDVVEDRWIPEFAAAVGLGRLRLPELCDAGAAIGVVRGAGPLIDGAVIVVGGHDHLCAGIGAGADGDADLVDSMGTGEAVSRRSMPDSIGRDDIAAMVRRGLTVGRHVVAGRFSVMEGLGSGLVLKRALELAGLSAPPDASRLAAADEDGFAEWRAALDEVAERARRAAAKLDGFLGPHDRLVACGGWLRNDAVRETKRRALGSFDWSPVDEPGALGAAVLGAQAAGARIAIPPARPVGTTTITF